LGGSEEIEILFLVLARDKKRVDEKIRELKNFGVPYLVVCGENLNYPDVVLREPKGKYDALNFGAQFIAKHVNVVILNDVDTRINNFEAALQHFNREKVGLLFARVSIKEGPQRLFYVILDLIRRSLPITASGELMLIRHNLLKKILPIRPCKAEDSYILFKALEIA